MAAADLVRILAEVLREKKEKKEKKQKEDEKKEPNKPYTPPQILPRRPEYSWEADMRRDKETKAYWEEHAKWRAAEEAKTPAMKTREEARWDMLYKDLEKDEEAFMKIYDRPGCGLTLFHDYHTERITFQCNRKAYNQCPKCAENTRLDFIEFRVKLRGEAFRRT